jgi:hypothetical protein
MTWKGKEAYLNIIFKPATDKAIKDNFEMGLPTTLVQFLKRQNGAILFSSALGIYGVHEQGQLIDRENSFAQLPFNLVDENFNWPPRDPERFLAIASYSFDGSIVCQDRLNSQIYLFKREESRIADKPMLTWSSLEHWLKSEVSRLSKLFDSRGKLLVPEAQTLPERTQLV